MMYLWLYLLLYGFITLAPATAQHPDPMAIQRLQHNRQAGTNSAEELASLLHLALQKSDYNILERHLLGKQEYDKMMQSGTASVREALLLNTPDQLLIDFQLDFGNVLQGGAAQEINWPETTVESIKAAPPASAHNAVLIPVTLTLYLKPGLPVVISFNAARLDGKFYYFRPLQLQEEDLSQRGYR